MIKVYFLCVFATLAALKLYVDKRGILFIVGIGSKKKRDVIGLPVHPSS